MIKALTCLVLLLALAGASGCRTTMETPDGYKVRVEDPSGHPGGPPLCPPGHAKKGWC